MVGSGGEVGKKVTSFQTGEINWLRKPWLIGAGRVRDATNSAQKRWSSKEGPNFSKKKRWKANQRGAPLFGINTEEGLTKRVRRLKGANC